MTDLIARLTSAGGDEALSIRKADLFYLVALADWCAGQGFCQIDGLQDPDLWCFDRWSELGPANGDGYSAEALALALAAAALKAGEG